MSQNAPESSTCLERRKFERAYFSSTDDVTGIIIIIDRVESPITGNISHLSIGDGIDGNISDLSLGGLYLVTRKEKTLGLEIGDTLILKNIQATVLYNLELNIEMQIRRVNNYDFIEHTGLGCEFTSINAESREAIKQLVEWGLHANDSTTSCRTRV